MKSILSKLTYIGTLTVFPAPLLAQTAEKGAEAAKPTGAPVCIFGTPNDKGDCTGGGGIFESISNILIFLVGAIAVIVIIFGGLRYVTSTGDAARVKSAKDTILYGIIGLVVAILAFAIVNFVTGQLSVKPKAN